MFVERTVSFRLRHSKERLEEQLKKSDQQIEG